MTPACNSDQPSNREATLLARLEGGFSLIEMAVVMFIIVLLIGSILVPLGTQVEQRKISDTRRALDEIREALIGFAVINGRLPCPDYTNDPTNAAYGQENFPCTAAPTAEGYLPWKTLGVADLDAWGSKRTSSTSPRIGDWRYRVDRNFGATFTLSTSFADNLIIRNHAATDITPTERAIAIVFSTGPNTTADLQNASWGTNYQADIQTPSFDDILIWIARPTLFNRMVAAGKLP